MSIGVVAFAKDFLILFFCQFVVVKSMTGAERLDTCDVSNWITHHHQETMTKYFYGRVEIRADTQMSMKVETTMLLQHCPYKKRPEFSNLKRMKALQVFNGVYSRLLTTILYQRQTK